MARPSKFNEALKETILKLYKEGRTDDQVADIIGVSVRTLHNWKGKYPSFLHALKDSKLVADGLVEASLFSRACGFSAVSCEVSDDAGEVRRREFKVFAPDTTAAIFWLKNRQPEKWRENYQVDVNDLAKKSDEELEARIEKLLDDRSKVKVKKLGKAK